ncbi:hypothetical protein Nmel_008815 [Mimus melanotis]
MSCVRERVMFVKKDGAFSHSVEQVTPD